MPQPTAPSVDEGFGVVIEGAEAYWLEDPAGRLLGPEADGTGVPFARALELVRAGTSPEELAVWSRLADGRRYLVADGRILVDLAEAAAGIPARPRELRD